MFVGAYLEESIVLVTKNKIYELEKSNANPTDKVKALEQNIENMAILKVQESTSSSASSDPRGGFGMPVLSQGSMPKAPSTDNETSQSTEVKKRKLASK